MSMAKVVRENIALCLSLVLIVPVFGQVKPDEILNSRLKADESQFFPQLKTLQESIQAHHFVFPFRLSRFVTSKPGQPGYSDTNGIEFVYFEDMELLKVSGVYTASYNAASLSENERAAQTLQQAIVPILQLATEALPAKAVSDGIGFEIIYNSRDSEKAYDYEGQEVITAIFDWPDAIAYCQSDNAEERQNILNRSDIYVNGKAFGLALLQRNPFSVKTLERSVPNRFRNEKKLVSMGTALTTSPSIPSKVLSTSAGFVTSASDATAISTNATNEQAQFREELNAILAHDKEDLHLDSDVPPAFEEHGSQVALHITMRNPLVYSQNTTSIYKRSAQGFDLVIAPELKSLLGEVPSGANFSLFHFTLIGDDGSGKANAETIDYFCPLDSVRSLVANKITSQDLVDQSTILVNSVRIRINLQLVE